MSEHTTQTVKAQIQSLINKANETTGNSDTNLTDGVNALVSGYGQGGSGGIDEGYDVTFYDEQGEELALYSVKQGHTIEKPPKYACSVWKTSDGATVTFPYVPTSDISLYANNDTLADQLYEFYGVDKSAYPYVMVQVINKTTNASYPYTYKIAFFDTITTSINQPRLVGVNSNITQSTHDYYISELANIEGVVLAIKERIANISSSYSADIVDDNSTTMIYTHYTNFDYSFNYSTHYRLDEVTEPLPYDGLANGYDVMFYDENNEGLAFYSIKQGHTINPPVYNCKNWQDANGGVIGFPYTPSADAIFYANNSTYASQLYEYYGVDSAIYPCIAIYCYNGGSPAGIIFGGSIRTNKSNTLELNEPVLSASVPSYLSITDYADIQSVVSEVMAKILPDTLQTNGAIWVNSSTSHYHYLNFDCNLTDTKGKYRLDQ